MSKNLSFQHESAFDLSAELEESQLISKTGGYLLNLITGGFFLSRGYLAIHELDRNFESLEQFCDILYPEDRARIESIIFDVIDTVREGREVFDRLELQYRIISQKTKSIKFIKDIIKPRFENGKLIGIRGVIQDVTDLAAKETKLQLANKLLKESQSLAKLGGWEIDVQTKAITWLYGEEDHYGIKKQPQSLKEYLQYVIPADRPIIYDTLREYFAGKANQTTGRFRIVAVNGKVKTINTTIIPVIEDDKLVKIRAVTQDITSQVEREHTIKSFSEDLVESQRLSQTGSWSFDIGTETVQVSEGLLEIFEMPLGRHPSPWDFLRAVHPDDRSSVKKKLGELTQPMARSHDVQLRIITTAGTIRYLRVVAKTVVENKSLVGVKGVAMDITAFKEYETQIHNAKEKFERIFQDSGIGMAIADYSGRFIEVNDAFCRMIGFNRHELIGLRFADITHPEDIEVNAKQYSDITRGKSKRFTMEKRYVRKDGSLVTGLLTVSFIEELRDGSGFTLGQVQDITDLRKQEVLRIENEKKFRVLVESSVIGVGFSKGEKMFYANPTLMRLFGYTSLREFSKKTLYDLATPGTKELLAIRKEKVNEGKPVSDFFQGSFRTKQGATIILEIHAKILDIAEETFSSTVVVDVTEKVEARRKLEDTNSQLEKTLHELKIASETKENFLSIMSHEIRTPLNAVIGLSNLLMRRAPRPDQIALLKTLKSSADNLMHLVNDILDFNKIRLGKVQLENIIFSLTELLEQQHATFRISAQDKGLEFVVNIDPRIPDKLEGDITRINQILTNLVTNAIKFTHKGFVKLSVELLSLKENSCVIIFKVQDSGVGIASDKLGKVFDPFHQTEAYITRQYGGTGLGLSIVKSLVDLFQGQIIVESEFGQGSTFIVQLELKVPQVVAQKTNVPGVTSVADLSRPAEKLSVLYVEDVESNRFLTQYLLEGYGIRCTTVPSGKDALLLTTKEKFDVILMDLQMPEMDGYETTRRIRSQVNGLNNFMPILAFTADPYTPELKNKTLLTGIQYVITKPFDPDNLVKRIKWYATASEFRDEGFSFLFYETLFQDNPKELLKMKKAIISDLKKLQRNVCKYDKQRNILGIREELHKLKPIIKNLGATELITLFDQYRLYHLHQAEVSELTMRLTNAVKYMIERMQVLIKVKPKR